LAIDIRLLTDAVAAMTDPLAAAIGTGDHFAAIIFPFDADFRSGFRCTLQRSPLKCRPALTDLMGN
jgi:hypothetical protein